MPCSCALVAREGRKGKTLVVKDPEEELMILRGK